MSPDDFAKVMQEELENNSYKGDFATWKPSPDELRKELAHHHEKLQLAIRERNFERIQEHSADLANISMKAYEMSQ